MNLRETVYRTRYAFSIIEVGSLALTRFTCPLCGGRVLLRLSRGALGVRCLPCRASAITLSVASVLQKERPEFRRERVYEQSSRGPLFEFLKREVSNLTFSEYFDDVTPGESRDGVLCQDVQQLTYADASFDVATSTEVFEHVPDDRKGFAEIRRVLRPGGVFIFSVPLSDTQQTVERAVLREGVVHYLLPATYHDDRIRGREKVLVYRDYGRDITDRLREAGFGSARIEATFERAFLGHGRPVVVARA